MDPETASLSLDSAVELMRASDAPAPEQEQEQQPPAEAEAAPQESEAEAPATPEGEQAEVEVEAEQIEPVVAIDPPVSWSKEDREVFAKLDPDAQRVIAQREKAREAEINRRLQETAANEKRLAEVQAAFEQERLQLYEALTARLPQPPDDALIDDDPVEYMRQQAQYNREIAEYQQLATKRQQEAQRLASEQQRIQAEEMRAEAQRLTELIPDIADPVKGPQLKADIVRFATDSGIPQDALATASATEIHILHKAMKWDAAQKAALAAKAKPVPKVSTPGSARTSAEQAADARRSAIMKLEHSGSIEDALAALRA